MSITKSSLSKCGHWTVKINFILENNRRRIKIYLRKRVTQLKFPEAYYGLIKPCIKL